VILGGLVVSPLRLYGGAKDNGVAQARENRCLCSWLVFV
jgi:hypothetical protein